MKITQDDVVQRQTVLQVELEPEDLEKYLNWAYKRVVQHTNIPGFRKGKAPRAIVERFVGQHALIHEALDYLATDSASAAIDQQNLETAGSPQVEIEQLEPPIQLKVTVPLIPVVELDSYLDIRLAEEVVEVKQEQVQETLEQLQRESAPWEPVDRPVELGDMLTMQVKGTVDSKTILEEKDAVYIAEEGNQRPFPGFSQKLIGLPKDESKEFVLAIPEDYPDSDLAGKECQFSVSVTEIKERKLPELNDEFAKGVGEGYDSLEALREKMRDNLEASAKEEVLTRYRNTVIETVVQGAQIELPPILVERAIDNITADQQEALKQHRLDMEQYLAQVGKTEEQLREEVKDQAIQRLQHSLVLNKVKELEDIEVTTEEVEAKIEALVSDTGDREQGMRRLFESESGKESIRNTLITEKVVDRLVTIAKGEAPEPEKSDEPQPPPEEVPVQEKQPQ